MADDQKNQKGNEKVMKLVEEIEKLSVLEVSELVKALEEKFGVQAIAPVAMAAPAGGEAPAPAEEKSTFTVVITNSGSNKINVIKALREIKPDLGLKEAKDITEQLPAEILAEAKKEDAEAAKKKLEEAGATVELK